MSTETVREMRQYTEDADFFPAEWESECLKDYAADCRANPCEQLPDYAEYKWLWAEERIRDEWDKVTIEAEMERDYAEQMRRMPAPIPCGEDEIPF